MRRVRNKRERRTEVGLRNIVSGLFGEWNPRLMPRYFFWGVRSMYYKTAERADVSKQNYTVCPRHWYVDATFSCRECGKEFVFTAAEQRFWYEDKQFYVDSCPKICIICRRAERTRLELRRRYDALIAEALQQCPDEKKQEAIALICEIEATEEILPERMKENRKRLLKQLRSAEGGTADKTSPT